MLQTTTRYEQSFPQVIITSFVLSLHTGLRFVGDRVLRSNWSFQSSDEQKSRSRDVISQSELDEDGSLFL